MSKKHSTQKPISPKPVEDVPRLAKILESNLEAHGALVRVLEVNVRPQHLEFQLEFAKGVPLSKFEELSRDIALFLASPTGKVELVLPIPGTHRFGINLPRRSENNQLPNSQGNPFETEVREKTMMYHLRNFLADILLLVDGIIYNAAVKLYLSERVTKPSVTSKDIDELKNLTKSF